MKPQLGIISVGVNQGSFRHPRRYVVNSVLLGPKRPECVNAAVLDLLLQTDDGIEEDCDHCGTNDGLTVGDILIKTDGHNDYRIQVSGCISGKKLESKEGYGWICIFDEDISETENTDSSDTALKKVCEEVAINDNERMISRCDDK